MFKWIKTKTDEPKTLGEIGELLAQEEYKNRGYKIIAANFFNKKGKRLGEVDFIACYKHTIIFVEVKTRKEEKGFHGTPVEAVDYFKQIKILKAVKAFLLKETKYLNFKPQIDVVSIIINDFRFLEQVEERPAKYLIKCGLDKLPKFVKIIPNAVEDWS